MMQQSVANRFNRGFPADAATRRRKEITALLFQIVIRSIDLNLDYILFARAFMSHWAYLTKILGSAQNAFCQKKASRQFMIMPHTAHSLGFARNRHLLFYAVRNFLNEPAALPAA